MLPRKRTVGDLLGVVLALSARTRRMVQEPVQIDIDVFAPAASAPCVMSSGAQAPAVRLLVWPSC